uniref:Uncharacterized protein n=1 Tax=viral metagenome TaxID=1070528 RepID=A0A6C0CFC9_9ZZZZ
MPKEEDENSICSDKETETKETIIVKDEDDDDDDDDEEEPGEEGDEDEEEEDDEEEDDDDDEYDPAIIQFELFKNFLTDKEGNNVATHLGSISHELRKLNKIAVKLLEKK